MDGLKNYLAKPGSGADIAHAGSTLVGTVNAFRSNGLQADAYKAAGKNTKKLSDFMTAQYAARGKEAVATGQRGALAEQRQARLAMSKAQAVAAASGGGASDPTVQHIIGGLASEGNTNALSALYSGQSTEADYANYGAAAKFNASSDAAGYNLKSKAYSNNKWDDAIGTLLDGSTSFLEKYG